MNDELFPRHALAKLRMEGEAPIPENAAAREEPHVLAMDRFLQGERRRSRRVRWGWLAAAAGVVLGATALGRYWAWPRPAPTGLRVHELAATANSPKLLSGAVRLSRGAPPGVATAVVLVAGDRVEVAPREDALIELASGALVHVAGDTHVQLPGEGASERLGLTQGRIDLAVPHLDSRTLAVETPNARVQVVGTRFSVIVESSEGHSHRTCVSVSEGRVWVTTRAAQRVVSAGAHWSSDGAACAGEAELPVPAASGSAEPSAPSTGLPPTGAAPHGPAPGARRGVAAGASSALPADDTSSSSHSLAEQNRLFSAALQARERGELARARAYLDELLTRYPDCSFAAQAQRERRKLDQRLEGSR